MDSVDTVETLWSLGSTAGHMDNTVESDQVGLPGHWCRDGLL